jgi:hypothetical protein
MTTAKVTVEKDENIFSKMVTYAESNSDTIYTSIAILTILAYVVNTQMMVNLALWVVVLSPLAFASVYLMQKVNQKVSG